MKIFAIVFTFIALSMTYLTGRIYIDGSQLSSRLRIFLWSIHIICTAFIILGPIVYRSFPDKNPSYFLSTFMWTSYIVFGFYTLLWITIFPYVISEKLLFSKIVNDPILSEERRVFFRQLSSGIIFFASTIFTATGFIKATARPRIKKVTVPITNLPSSFQNFTITQLSDVHVGPLIRSARLEMLVEMANTLNSDCIVLTGDLIDGTVEQLKDQVRPFENLKAPHGKFVIPGNHEYYWGMRNWLKHFESLGLTNLTNTHHIIEKNQERIIMAGVHDYSVERFRNAENPDFISSAKNALKNAPEQITTKILLAHQPRSIYEASEQNISLQLSGHTHSGQYFPFNILIHLFQPYSKGLHRYKNSWIYVNPGTCYWGPPNRLGEDAEITQITLVRA